MRLVCTVFFFGFFGFITCTFAHIQCDSNRTVIRDLKESERMLSRSRRYLSFPKSSSFVVTLTGLKSIQLREPTNWNLDLEFDMIWPIPSETVKKKSNRPMKKYTRLHRHKRDLYSNIELSLNRLGLPGRDCMLRTICEARGFLHPPGVSFVDDLLRVILRVFGDFRIIPGGLEVMEWNHWGLTLCILFSALATVSLSDNEGKKLSRRRRYVVFPEGSSFSIALCMTIHTLTPDNIFTEGLNWGISYDLPNESKPALEPFLQLRKDRPILSKYHYKLNKDHIRNENSLKYNHWHKNTDNRFHNLDDRKKYYYRKSDYDYIKRRHRRELYNKLEVIMDAMGFQGRACIQRALCEASQRLMGKGNSLIEEMMRITFSLPLKRVLLSHEPVEHHIYTEAHRAGQKGTGCDTVFSGCPFSLIDMALGKYSGETGSQPDLSEPVEDISGNSVMRYVMK